MDFAKSRRHVFLPKKEEFADQAFISFQKGNILRGKGMVVVNRQILEPDWVFGDIEVKRDHGPVFTPKLIEYALHKGSFTAFAAGKDDSGLGKTFRNISEPFAKVLPLSLPTH